MIRTIAYLMVLAIMLSVLVPLALAGDHIKTHRLRKSFRIWKLDRNVALRAIAIVETGENAQAVGKLGELTEYQFMRATWRDYSNFPFQAAARYPEEVQRVAYAHLQTIISHLAYRNTPAKAEHIFAAWRFGHTRAEQFAGSDYARRAANIYYDLLP